MTRKLGIKERVTDMASTRILGFSLLGVSGLAIAGAVALGIYARSAELETQTLAFGVGALAVLAEVCFWLGGGMLGLSIIRRRREALGRFFSKLAFWRRPQNGSAEQG